MTGESPIIEEIREGALKIEERFDHDLHRYCQYLREREKEDPDRIVDQPTVVRSAPRQEPAIG